MKIFQFEMKKLWHQKKFLWLFIVVLLCTYGIFQQNAFQQSLKPERALEKIKPFLGQVNRIQYDLQTLKEDSGLDELQVKQLENADEMGRALLYWKVAINHQEWGKIPTYEGDFLKGLEQFEGNGGKFEDLQGMEREKAIQKNTWLAANNLPYEDEAYPLSPVLFLKQIAEGLFSIFGVLILLLFFGATITAEREQGTWLTLKTQPIPRWQRFAAKYASLLMVLIVFFVMVTGFGLLIPLVWGDSSMNLQYPQIIGSGDTFVVISTFSYLIKGGVLFICASVFVFSLILLYSVWFKNTFSALMLISATIFLGFIVTDKYLGLQTPFNPF